MYQQTQQLPQQASFFDILKDLSVIKQANSSHRLNEEINAFNIANGRLNTYLALVKNSDINAALTASNMADIEHARKVMYDEGKYEASRKTYDMFAATNKDKIKGKTKDQVASMYKKYFDSEEGKKVFNENLLNTGYGKVYQAAKASYDVLDKTYKDNSVLYNNLLNNTDDNSSFLNILRLFKGVK